MNIMNNNGQVWLETVIYTLIGLSIIGIMLGIIKPAMDERRYRLAIEQSIDVLNYIDEKINEVKMYGTGNSRPFEVKIGAGKLVINGDNDTVSIVIDDSAYEYSQPDSIVPVGNINALTVKKGKKYSVKLTLDYLAKLNITSKGKDEIRSLQSSNSPYDIEVVNKGITNNLVNIDVW